MNLFKKKKSIENPWEMINSKDRENLLSKSFLNEESTSELLRFYFNLLHLSSPSGDEYRIRNQIIIEAGQWGIDHYKTDRAGNLIMTIPGREGYPVLGFTAHMDTYLKKREIMTPGIKGKRVVNRSSSILGGDDKAAIAGFMMIAREAKLRKIPCEIRLLFTAHEENMCERGHSFGAKMVDRAYLKDVDLLFAMDVPSGKNIKKRNFLVYHMADDDPLLSISEQMAASTGISAPYMESQEGGYIGGDATVFYKYHRMKVLDFGTGNFHEHTRHEYTDLEIYLEQLRWVAETFFIMSQNSPDSFDFPLPA